MSSRHVRIAQGGRVVIPVELRKALGVAVGDDVVIELRGSCGSGREKRRSGMPRR